MLITDKVNLYLLSVKPQDKRQERGRVESFGARLKREREQRGVTLDDIALTTKIGKRFLSALEEDRFDQLPGGIFSKGFVRAYARHLAIDEEQAVADYLSATTPAATEQQPQNDLPIEVAEQLEDRQSNVAVELPWGLFAALLLMVALGVAVWVLYSREKQKQSSNVQGIQNS